MTESKRIDARDRVDNQRQQWISHNVTEEQAGMTVEQIARDILNVSGRMLQRLTRSKGILLNRKKPYLQREVKAGDRISVRISDKPDAAPVQLSTTKPIVLPAGAVLYEDEHFIIVNKPAGMMVHPVSAEHTETLIHALAYYWQEKGEASTPHSVHRLDKETSGAVLVAKSGYAHQMADRLLREGAIERDYLAAVMGQVATDADTIHAPIARDPKHRTKRCVSESGEEAITHYQVLVRGDETTLTQVRLETGRTHQIRVHFQHIGHSLVGDTMYGGRRSGFYRQALHAHRLAFTHPQSGQDVVVVAPAPEDLAIFFKEQFGYVIGDVVK